MGIFKNVLFIVIVVILSLDFSLATININQDKHVKGLNNRLNYVFKEQILKNTKLGIEVFSLTKNQSLYSRNTNMVLSPASTIKVLTAAIALKKLGPQFKYKTEVLSDAKINKGKLSGNLYLKGGGDPTLVTEQMYLLASRIKDRGLKEFTGDLIVDESVFDSNYVSEHRINSNSMRPYNAKVNGLSFNYNTTTIVSVPTTVGVRPELFDVPNTDYIKIVNKAKTVKGGGRSLAVTRSINASSNILTFNKSVGVKAARKEHYYNVTEPAIYAGYALIKILQDTGVILNINQVKIGKVNSSARSIAFIESLPMSEIVRRMNKFSNNFIAESLVKTIGQKVYGGQGTTEKGLRVLNEEATGMGMNTSGFNVVSGSGLTRKNRVSSNQYMKMLKSVYQNFDIFPELMTSLPIAGLDGTLKSRMKDSSAYGKLRGKTGTINGVSTMIGFVKSKGGEILAYSVLMNDNSLSPRFLREWQNYFGTALADFAR